MAMQALLWPITTAVIRTIGPSDPPAGKNDNVVLAPKPDITRLRRPADAGSGSPLPAGDHLNFHAVFPRGKFATDRGNGCLANIDRPSLVLFEPPNLTVGEGSAATDGHRPFSVQSFLDFAENNSHVTSAGTGGSFQIQSWVPNTGGILNDRWLDISAAQPRNSSRARTGGNGFKGVRLPVRQLYRPGPGMRAERTGSSRVTQSRGGTGLGVGGRGEGVASGERVPSVVGFSRTQGSYKPRILPDRVMSVVNLVRRLPPGVSLPEALVRWEGRLSLRDMNTVMKELQNWRKAAEFLDWMKGKGMVDICSYTLLLKGLVRARQWRGVEELLGAMVREGGPVAPDNVAYCIAISGASKGRRPYEAARWFAQMKVAGCQPDAITYNAMIDGYGRAGMYREAVGVMNEMRTAGVHPDRVTYGSLLAACGRGREGGVEEAKQVFSHMKERGIADTVAYSTMIDLYGKKGAAEEALGLFREMQGSDRCECDCASWNAAITALGRGGRLEEAHELFREMRVSDTPPDRITFSTLIWMFGMGGQCEKAENILRMMEGEGWGGDEYAYNALLSSFARMRRWDDAVRVFEEMNAKGCDYGEVTYSAMMAVFCKAGQLSFVEGLFAKMKADGLVPNAVVYSCMVDAYGKAREVDKAIRVFEEMRGEGCEPNEFTYNSLIDMFGKTGRIKEAELTFQEMRVAGCRPDRITFSSLINARGAAGQVEEAIALFKEMRAHKCVPDAILYGTMIKVYSRAGRFQEAVAVFEEMRRGGLEADELMYVSALEVHWKAGLREEAKVLFGEMKERGMGMKAIKGEGEVFAKKRKGKRKGAVSCLSAVGGAGEGGEEGDGGEREAREGDTQGAGADGWVQGKGEVRGSEGISQLEEGVVKEYLWRDTLGAKAEGFETGEGGEVGEVGEVLGDFAPGLLMEWVGMGAQGLGFRNAVTPFREALVGVRAQAKKNGRNEKLVWERDEGKF